VPTEDTQSPQAEPKQPDSVRLNETEETEPLDRYAEQLPEPLSPDQLLRLFQVPPLNTDIWVFRGQSRPWPLKPLIERILSAPIIPVVERQLVREFRDRAHHFMTKMPEEGDDIGWLSLMQQHGAPTRLLDWTVSPYVAAFFALEEPPGESPPVIWAINRGELDAEALRLVQSWNPKVMPHDIHGILRDWHNPFVGPVVVPVQPRIMNERLTVQKAAFLYAHPTLNWTFEGALKHLLQRKDPKARWLYKLLIAPVGRLQLLNELDRMNVSAASLFPGLDGFARSLKTRAQTAHMRWY
jgi:hypothetical protein